MFHTKRLSPAETATLGSLVAGGCAVASRAACCGSVALAGLPRVLGRRALELADHAAASVEERELRLLALVPEPVLERHARQRVRARVDVLRDLLATWLVGLAVRDHRRAGHAVVLAYLRRLREAHVDAVAHRGLRGEQMRATARQIARALP